MKCEMICGTKGKEVSHLKVYEMEQQPSVEICVLEAEPMRRGDDDPRCGAVLSLFSVCQFRGACCWGRIALISEGLQWGFRTCRGFWIARGIKHKVLLTGASSMLKFGGEDMLSLKMGWYPLKLPTRISSLGSLLPYRTSWKLSARGNSRSNRPGAKFFWQGCNAMDIGPWFLVRSFFVWDCWHFGAWTLERWLGHRSCSRLSEVMFIEQQKFEKASSQV